MLHHVHSTHHCKATTPVFVWKAAMIVRRGQDFRFVSIHGACVSFYMRWAYKRYDLVTDLQDLIKSKLLKIYIRLLSWVRFTYRLEDILASWLYEKKHLSCGMDFQQFDILTNVDSDEPVQSPFKLRNAKSYSVSSLTLIELLKEIICSRVLLLK